MISSKELSAHDMNVSEGHPIHLCPVTFLSSSQRRNMFSYGMEPFSLTEENRLCPECECCESLIRPDLKQAKVCVPRIMAVEVLQNHVRVELQHVEPQFEGEVDLIDRPSPCSPKGLIVQVLRACGITASEGASVNPKETVGHVVRARYAAMHDGRIDIEAIEAVQRRKTMSPMPDSHDPLVYVNPERRDPRRFVSAAARYALAFTRILGLGLLVFISCVAALAVIRITLWLYTYAMSALGLGG